MYSSSLNARWSVPSPTFLNSSLYTGILPREPHNQTNSSVQKTLWIDFEWEWAVQTDIEPIRCQKMVFTQIVHGKKCSLDHEETFFSWKFSLKTTQQKDMDHIQGCYNENQYDSVWISWDTQPDVATIEQQQTVVVVEAGESVFKIVQCLRFSWSFRRPEALHCTPCVANSFYGAPRSSSTRCTTCDGSWGPSRCISLDRAFARTQLYSLRPPLPPSYQVSLLEP